MSTTTEERALAALAEHEAISRQQETPDPRMVAARRFLESQGALTADVEDEAVIVVRDLFYFALERLRVNRGLMAAAKGVLEPEVVAGPDLAQASTDDLFREMVRRGLITVSGA